jgi:O-antigen ligase
VLSTINSVNITESIMFFIRFVSLLAIYLLIYNIVQKENDALRVIKCVIYSSIIPMIFGFYQYITGKGILSSEFYRYRLNSTFTHPNMYAFYLVIIFFSIMYLYFLEKHINGKSDMIFKVCLSISVLIQLVFTYSRGSWIGTMVGLLVVALFINKSRKWILISSLVFIALFSPQIVSRILDLINPPSKNYISSWEFRLEIWGALIKNAFIHKPFLGYGLGQSTFAAEKYSQFSNYPHNDYLRVLIEIGLAGLISFLLFLAHNLWSLYKKIRIGIYSELNTILLGLFVALLVSSFAGNLIYAITVVSYFFIMLAVGQKLNYLDSANIKK